MPVWREGEPGYAQQMPGPPHIIERVRADILRDLLEDVMMDNEQVAEKVIERVVEKMPDDVAFDTVRNFVEERRRPGPPARD